MKSPFSFPPDADDVIDLIAALGAVVLIFSACVFVWVKVTHAGRKAIAIRSDPPESFISKLILFFLCLLVLPASAVEVRISNYSSGVVQLTNGASAWHVNSGGHVSLNLDAGTFGLLATGQTSSPTVLTIGTNQTVATSIDVWNNGGGLGVEAVALPSTLGNYTKGFTLGVVIFGTLWLIRMASQAGKEQVDP